VSNKDSVTT